MAGQRNGRVSCFGRLVLTAVVLSGGLCGCSVPGPDSSSDTFGLDFTMPPGAETRGAMVFFVDGLNAAVFEEMLEAGELPAIRSHFADRGLYAPRAVANTPSVTMANLTSFVTGKLAGHHGVTGINWFDRNRLIWRDYDTVAQKNTLDGDYQAKSIYEHFHDRTTFSVFFQPHRGATKFIENALTAAPLYGAGWYESMDRLTLYRLNIVADVARKRGRFPAVTICYLLAPDFRAYDHGVDSPQYRRAIKHTDRQIGRVLGDLKRAGLLDKLVIVLVSDHGMAPVSRHFPMDEFLRDVAGLDIAPRRLWENTPFEKRLEYYRKFQAVTYGSGDRYWAICLRKTIRRDRNVVGFEPWPLRPSAGELEHYPVPTPKNLVPRSNQVFTPDRRHLLVDLPGLLVRQEAVDAVAYHQGPDRVCVRTGLGKVQFAQPRGAGGPISYRIVHGSDPLGWEGKVPAALLSGKPAGGRAWLGHTHQTAYPDLPEQILAYFRAPRAGDLAVFAAPQWDFGRVNRAGHGGVAGDDMHVPLMLGGPGVPKRRIHAVRTVDVMPTLLRLLGRAVPPGLDGQDLITARESATTKTSPQTAPRPPQ